MISSAFRDDFAPPFQGTREVKGLLRGPTDRPKMSPAPADECLDQTARHKTLFEAYRGRNLPTGRGRGFERNDQGLC